jgi:hypothetical protein
MSIIKQLDEFTERQGIVSAEWCKLLHSKPHKRGKDET